MLAVKAQSLTFLLWRGIAVDVLDDHVVGMMVMMVQVALYNHELAPVLGRETQQPLHHLESPGETPHDHNTVAVEFLTVASSIVIQSSIKQHRPALQNSLQAGEKTQLHIVSFMGILYPRQTTCAFYALGVPLRGEGSIMCG